MPNSLFAAERTADRIPILLTDPHLTWEGLAVLYEARVHAGDLHMNGYFLIGSPIVGIGHTQHVGWAFASSLVRAELMAPYP